MNNCKAMTTSGAKCRAKPKAGDSYCFIHSPKYAADRAAARRKGGAATKTPHGGNVATIPNEITNIQDARKILVYALAELAPMDNTLQRVRAYLALFDSYVHSIETSELEARITALEAMNK